MPPSIVLKDKNGKLVLLGGNTRLMGGAAAGTSMPVKVVEVDSTYDEKAGEKATGGGSEGAGKAKEEASKPPKPKAKSFEEGGIGPSKKVMQMVPPPGFTYERLDQVVQDIQEIEEYGRPESRERSLEQLRSYYDLSDQDLANVQSEIDRLKPPPFKERMAQKAKQWAAKAKGLKESGKKTLKELPGNTQKFVTDKEFRDRTMRSAGESLKDHAKHYAHELSHHFKHEVEEISHGLKRMKNGEMPTKAQTKAMAGMAIELAVASLAIGTAGMAGAGAALAKSLAKHLALSAINPLLGDAYVFGLEGSHLIHALDSAVRIAAEKSNSTDPKDMLEDMVKAIGESLEKGISDETIIKALNDSHKNKPKRHQRKPFEFTDPKSKKDARFESDQSDRFAAIRVADAWMAQQVFNGEALGLERLT